MGRRRCCRSCCCWSNGELVRCFCCRFIFAWALAWDCGVVVVIFVVVVIAIDFCSFFGVDCLLWCAIEVDFRGGGAVVGSSVDLLGILLWVSAVGASSSPASSSSSVDVIFGVFLIGLYGLALLLLSSSACAVDCGDGVCVIGAVFVGVIWCSVIASASSSSPLSLTSPWTC